MATTPLERRGAGPWRSPCTPPPLGWTSPARHAGCVCQLLRRPLLPESSRSSGRQQICYYASPKDFFTIPVRQRILYYSSHKGFLYYSSPTKNYLLFLSHIISLVFQSDKGFFIIPLKGSFYYSSPTNDLLLFHSQGFLYHSSPTKDLLLFLSQGSRYDFSPTKDFYHPSFKGFLYYSNPTKDSFIF